MKRSKMFISFMLIGTMVMSGILSGCQNGKGDTKETASSTAAGESKEDTKEGSKESSKGGKITIFQQKTEIYDQLKALAVDYEKETGVEVEIWQISGDDYYKNLKTYLSSESGPTIFSLSSNTEIAELSAYLEDLGDLEFLDKIQEDLIGTSDGKTIGIPMTAEGFGLVYNKDLVKAEDLKDTDSIISFIEQEKANDVTGVGLSQEAYFLIGQILNTPFALQKDPAAFTQSIYAGEVNLKDVKEFQEFAKIYAAIRENQKNPLEISYDDSCGNFATGKAATIHQGNWCYSLFESYDMTFDTAIMPLPIAGNDKIAVGVPSVWCVNTDATDEEQQMSKDFLNWLYTSETGTNYLMNEFGFIPVVDGMVSEQLDPLSASVAEAIKNGNIIPWTFNQEWPAGIITTYLQQIAEEFFTSDMTEEEFLQEINDAFITASQE